MNRLEMKPPEFDSYEIEEPSDEERASSRLEAPISLNKSQTREANAQLAGGMLTCKHTGRRVYAAIVSRFICTHNLQTQHEQQRVKR